MIVILDGLEGTGKSTAAKIMSEAWGLPVYRAFRTNSSEHWAGDTQLEQLLRDLRVPVNTYVEDLYVADLLATIGGDVILDRSMPSAVAYGTLHNDWSDAEAERGFEYWVQCLAQRDDVYYIYMICHDWVASTRSSGRRARKVSEHMHLDAKFTWCWREMCARFSAHSVDTSTYGVDGMMAEIADKIGKEIRA